MSLITFNSGQKAKSSEVNANFVYLENEIIDERTELNGDYEVLSGCLVTVNSPEDTAINIASGKVLINGLVVSVAEQLNETLSAADGSNPRYDVICVDNTGVISVITGTPATTPVVPTLIADKCPLATILRPAGNDNALDVNLYDGRYFRNKPYVQRNNTKATQSGSMSSAGWQLRKTLIVPPFVWKKTITVIADYSVHFRILNGEAYNTISGNRDRLLINMNGSSILTGSSETWALGYLSNSVYSGYNICNAGGGLCYDILTTDDVGNNQFITFDLYLRRDGTSTTYRRTNNSNDSFIIKSE